MKKKVSLKDIAEKVGVSIALVSYVLNNKKQDRISKTVAQRIKETAKELNYRVNHIARSLKMKKTFTIGLVLADISNSFSSSLARIIEDEAGKYSYTVLFGSSDEDAEKSFKLINVLLNHQVDGLIIAPSENSAAHIEYLQENEVPFVLIDRYFPGIDANHIAIDNFKAAYSIVQHVIDEGHKRVGLVTYDTALFNLAERKRGYNECVSANNLPHESSQVKEVGINNTKENIEQAIDELLALPEPVDAILFSSNILSTHGLKYINRLKIKVPDQLAVVSFDQSDAADLFYAPLTHIKQPLKEMGQLATKTLMDCIERTCPLTKVNMEAELVIRKSSAKRLESI